MLPRMLTGAAKQVAIMQDIERITSIRHLPTQSDVFVVHRQDVRFFLVLHGYV